MNKNFKKVLISTALIASVSFAQDATANNETAQVPATETAVVAETEAATETVSEAPAAEAAAPAEESAPAAAAEVAAAPVAEAAAPVAETSSADAAAKAAVAEVAPAVSAEKPAAKESSFKLTGNVQTQAIKALYDNEKDNTLDGSFLRANIGGKFTSGDFEAVINIRLFSPVFGNTIDGKSYDKFSADTYYAKYKWDLGFGTLNTQFGRFRTDWSVGGNFGTYVDVDLNKRGFLARDYQHSAWQVGLESGVSTFSAFIAADDANLNTGYFRAEEALKLGDAKLAVAYHVNAFDAFQHTAEVTHRIAGRADYHFAKNFGLYGEVAYITTGDDADLSKDADGNFKVKNAIKSEYGQDTQYLPFFVGLEIPTGGLFNNVYAELEYVGDREDFQEGADELAWAVTFIKKVGSRTKFQVTAYSEKEVSDVALAARVTATIQ